MARSEVVPMHGRIIEVQTREGPILLVDQCILLTDQVEPFVDALREARNLAEFTVGVRQLSGKPQASAQP